MRLLKRVFWLVLATVFLIEAWFWDIVQPVVRRLVDALPLERLKALLRNLVAYLPAWAVLFVMGLPAVVLLPVKIVGLWLFATGHFLAGAALFVVAKSVGFVLVVFLFELCRPKLLGMAWFAQVYAWFVAARVWAHAQLDPARQAIVAWKSRILGENPALSRRFAALRRRMRRTG